MTRLILLIPFLAACVPHVPCEQVCTGIYCDCEQRRGEGGKFEPPPKPEKPKPDPGCKGKCGEPPKEPKK